MVWQSKLELMLVTAMYVYSTRNWNNQIIVPNINKIQIRCTWNQMAVYFFFDNQVQAH